MLKVRNLVFNNFQVNTYFLFDDTKECAIIDAACASPQEQKELEDLVTKYELKIVRNLNTHCHIDHILGNDFIFMKFGIRPEYHPASVPFLYTAKELAATFGHALDEVPEPAGYLEEGMKIRIGNSFLDVFYTPGHADGHVCFYDQEDQFVITGDVLFRDTIGRTDLPSGNFNLLMESIHDKLFILPDDTVVYPGHGPATTIGYEKINNPFIR